MARMAGTGQGQGGGDHHHGCYFSGFIRKMHPSNFKLFPGHGTRRIARKQRVVVGAYVQESFVLKFNLTAGRTTLVRVDLVH
jgi:hypothetical protein